MDLPADAIHQMEPSKEKMWAVIGHLGGLVPAYFLCILIPLFVWLLKGEASSFVNKQSKEALNFQISLVIYETVALVIAFTIIGIPIAFIAFMTFWILNIFCSLKGAIRTFKGKEYTYPWNLRLIK